MKTRGETAVSTPKRKASGTALPAPGSRTSSPLGPRQSQRLCFKGPHLRCVVVGALESRGIQSHSGTGLERPSLLVLPRLQLQSQHQGACWTFRGPQQDTSEPGHRRTHTATGCPGEPRGRPAFRTQATRLLVDRDVQQRAVTDGQHSTLTVRAASAAAGRRERTQGAAGSRADSGAGPGWPHGVPRAVLQSGHWGPCHPHKPLTVFPARKKPGDSWGPHSKERPDACPGPEASRKER